MTDNISELARSLGSLEGTLRLVVDRQTDIAKNVETILAKQNQDIGAALQEEKQVKRALYAGILGACAGFGALIQGFFGDGQ